MLSLDDKWIWDFWTARNGDQWHAYFLQADKLVAGAPFLDGALPRRRYVGKIVATDAGLVDRAACRPLKKHQGLSARGEPR